ncbi:MAG: hypothetical protein QXE05_08320, partial [Nitrososphaeria archaeon]
MKRLIFILLVVFLLCSNFTTSIMTNVAKAYTFDWEIVTRGIDGGVITAIAVNPKNPNIVYAGGSRGVGIYKSIDGGNNWFKPYDFDYFYEVESLIIDPVNPDTIYASTWDDGIWKSLDGGKAWQKLENFSGGFFCFDPVNSNIIYYGEQGGNLYKTTDSGQHWTLIKKFEGSGRTTVLVDKDNPNAIYIGAEYLGFYKSTDGGKTWQIKENQLYKKQVVMLRMDPTNNKTLFACGLGDMGVYKSTDGGETWKNVYNTGSFWDIAIALNKPQNLIAAEVCCGILRSTNYGETWQEIRPLERPNNYYTVAISPLDSNIVFLGSWGGGILKSTDGGNTWFESSFGIESASIFSFAITKNNNIYILLQNKGIYKSTDFGKTWARKDAGIDYYHFNWFSGSIVQDPSDPETLYVIRNCCGIFKTTNGGESWINLQNNWDNPRIGGFAIDPKNSNILYAGISEIRDPNGKYLGIVKSIDGGKSWQSVGLKERLITEIKIDPVSNILYAGTDKGLFKSLDEGKTWIDMKLPCNTQDYTYVRSIAIDTKNSPNVIYVGTINDGGYKTTDGGKTWEQIGQRQHIHVFAIDPNNSNIIYEAVWCNGIWMSKDAGKTWTQIFTKSSGDTCMRDVFVNPNDGRLYVANLNGLYRYVPKYSISAKSSKGGVISPSGVNYYKQGESQTFTFSS